MEKELSQRIMNEHHMTVYQEIMPYPSNMLLEVTNACNDQCIFCANSKMTRRKGFLSLGTGKRLLKEAYALGVREVGFYATGEPLLNKNLDDFIACAKELGYEYTYLTTNGALLTENRIHTLLQSGLDSIKFSINASNKEDYRLIHGTDDFYEVVENVKRVDSMRKEKKSKLKLFISCVLTRQTVEKKMGLEDQLANYVDEIFFLNACNFTGCMYEINDYLSVDGDGKCHYEDDICLYPFKKFIISCEGYLTMCCADYQNYLAVADLNCVSLKDAWNNDLAQMVRRKLVQHETDGILCGNCIHNCKKEVKPLVEELSTVVDMKNWCACSDVNSRIQLWQTMKKTK